jgi:hypothetical protein
MKLTTEQIECINQTLISKEFEVWRFETEVLDHIARIENEMEVSMWLSVVYNQVFWQWVGVQSRDFLHYNQTYPKIVNEVTQKISFKGKLLYHW